VELITLELRINHKCDHQNCPICKSSYYTFTVLVPRKITPGPWMIVHHRQK